MGRIDWGSNGAERVGVTENSGSFRILQPLGKGGMGEVHLAEDTRLGRKVALKFLSDEDKAPRDAREKLFREAKLASQLNHPHICTIHDIGEGDEGRGYIVMEHVEGDTLKEKVAEGPLSLESVVRYGVQLAEALSYAHDQGVVHRDLKSANIMINPDDRVKILDFGLAVQMQPGEIDDQSTALMDGEEAQRVAGTIHYMAPELLRGQPADKRSDIWALGVVLYEAITGLLPFTGETVYDVSSSIIAKPPAPMSDKVPSALGFVIERCLAKNPDERYVQTAEVHAALDILANTLKSAGTLALTGSPTGFWNLSALPSPERRARGVAPAAADPPPEVPPQSQALAVLPLKNLSGDPSQEYFADCITDALITDLAKIGSLTVISRASVMAYKNSDKPLPAIADDLKVDRIIEGSVLRAGDQVRVSAQLVDAISDANLWADSYTRDFTDIFQLQSDVARAIAGEIHIQLTPADRQHLDGRGKVDREAHEALLHGRHAMAKPENLGVAIDWFEKSIKLDPEYSMPYTLLAHSYLLLAMYGFRRPLDVFPVAKINAHRAIELDDASAEAHCILAWVAQLFDFDRQATEQGYSQSLTLNPGAEETHRLYGCYLIGTGRTEEGLAMLRRSVELDPLSPLRNAIYAYGLYVARQYSQAVEVCDQVVESHPRFWWARWVKGEVLTAKSKTAEAIAEYELALTASQNAFTMGSLGAAYALSGREDEARRLLGDLETQSKHRYVSPYFIGVIHLGLGDKETALDRLEQAWEERDGWVQWLLVNPAVDRVRSEERFGSLLKRIGLR